MMRNLRTRLMQRRALGAYASGDFDKAQSLFRRILDAQPGEPGARHNLALTCIALGDYDEAEELLIAELDRFGDYYPRLKVLADLYYIAGKREKANQFYRNALDCDAPGADHAILKRRIELTAEEQSYDRVMRANRSFDEGNRLLRDEQWDDAVREFTRAADFDETNVHALNNAGTIYLNHKNDPAQAIGFFKRALRWSRLPWIARNLAQAEKAIETGRSTL